ncbi:MAG: glycosyltransferase [Helicobacteraceae bacterium]|jgi:glycosyltransferase involved in cell wall biosynthesis|nr:glycosyltransferase [Helicobacteraceae bacterium]
MKICFFNMALAWGGGERWHLDAAISAKKEGHTAYVAAHKKGVLLLRAKESGIETAPFAIGNYSFLNPFKLLEVARFFRGFDVVVLNFSKDLKIAALAAKVASRSGGKIRVVYRRGLAAALKNSFYNRLIFSRFLDGVIVNSLATKASLLKNNKTLFPNDRIKLIYNGIDTAKFTPAAQKRTGGEIVVGTLGRCVYQKGHDLFLRIAAVLKRRGVQCRFRLGGSGELLHSLKRQAKSLGIADMVEFVGFVDEPSAFMRDLDIFALTSRWEGFGFVTAEALSCQVPVVAFNVSSTPEIVSNGENGFLIDLPEGGFDAALESFADKIELLIADTLLRTKMGENGRLRVCERFDRERNMSEALDYLAVIAKGAAADRRKQTPSG